MNDSSCLFCRIVNNETEAQILFENDSVVAFSDINPQAPVHLLIVPREHIATMNDVRPEHASILSELFLAASRIALDQGVERDGYRLVINCQEGAGQSVFHLHVHLLGGRRMGWPPG